MLSYSFRVLNEEKYHDIRYEEFDYTADLIAAILEKGISNQIRRGLGKSYIINTEKLSSPRGKIDVSTSVKEHSIICRKLACIYDEYNENTCVNQILKSTALLLIKSGDVKSVRKKGLKKALLYFNNVDAVDVSQIKWNQIHYSKNNATYKMLMNICYLAIKGLLLTEQKGNMKLAKYLDDRQMHVLYEKFILEYFKKHYSHLKPRPSQVAWNVDDGFLEMLPVMKTDIVLEYKGRSTIIDAKYYTRMLQYNQRFNKKTVHSDNMYQIFAYVKNKDVAHDGSVSGVLLYAKTDEDIIPNQEYLMSGNKISIKTLDLGADFNQIAGQLNEIADGLLY